MKISDILVERGPQGPVKPTPSAVVKSPSLPTRVPQHPDAPPTNKPEGGQNKSMLTRAMDGVMPPAEGEEELPKPIDNTTAPKPEKKTPGRTPGIPIVDPSTIPWGPKHPHWPGSA